MLVVANNLLEAEATVKADEREKFLEDKCPPLELPYSKDELVVGRSSVRPYERRIMDHMFIQMFVSQELCQKLHEQITISEEERYSIEFKLNMVLNEVRRRSSAPAG